MIAVVVAIAVFAFIRIVQTRQGSKKLPPGPPPWPLIGKNYENEILACSKQLDTD